MKIRSITYFMNVGWPLKDDKLQEAGIFLSTARSAFENAGYEVQTTRIAVCHLQPCWGQMPSA